MKEKMVRMFTFYAVCTQNDLQFGLRDILSWGEAFLYSQVHCGVLGVQILYICYRQPSVLGVQLLYICYRQPSVLGVQILYIFYRQPNVLGVQLLYI